ncbi:MAG: phosphoadenosine phosphosulfate reductase family protein, partial [Candidatus Lokiarchaeota archaeon]|nr:phosphoadenosine phosphosulfate reductase family protein [Candidatus Lokiarchaeota archaeon]
ASCDVPVLRGKHCPACKAELAEVELAPPGDVRPAFGYDMALLREACDAAFMPGVGAYLFPDNALVLLNKVGSLDLDYQVIVHGAWAGNLRYDIFKRAHAFMPALEGAKWIYKYYTDKGLFRDGGIPPKCIEYKADAEQFIAKGANILVPGIARIDKDAREGDPCIVHSPNGVIVAGHFTAGRGEVERLLAEGKGRVAKPKHWGAPVPAAEILDPGSFPPRTWKDAVAANESIIDKNIRSSIGFIHNTIDAYHELPVAVAYSGGKDSLATLLLVRKAIGPGSGERQRPFSVFFADTGLELPEVLQNVQDVVSWAGLGGVYFTRSAGDRFWSLAEDFGPPARDFRFCCHTLKASQINDMVEEMVAKAGSKGDPRILVFLGQRQYESFSRAEDNRVYTNSYVPHQVIGTPIKQWSALDEWLFLLREQMHDPTVPINPLYFQGHDRLGCYLCPAQSVASIERVRETHPDLYERWHAFLERYRGKQGYPVEWLDWGLWRFKHPKGQWRDVFARLPAGTTPQHEAEKVAIEGIRLHVSKGASPCTAGGFSVKARFSLPLVLPELLPWVRTLDKRVQHDESSGLLYIYEPDIRFMLFADGSLFLQSPDEKYDFDRFLVHLLGVTARSIACERCGVCINVCPTGAITKDGDGCIQIDAGKCAGIGCQKCTHHCPVHHAVKGNVVPATGPE